MQRGNVTVSLYQLVDQDNCCLILYHFDYCFRSNKCTLCLYTIADMDKVLYDSGMAYQFHGWHIG